MENYLSAWTGGLGRYVLSTADAALRKAGVVPDPVTPERDWRESWPVVRSFYIRYPTSSAESIRRFYDGYGVNRRYVDTYRAKAREGDVAAM
jgi:hypothetical protein